MPGADAVLDGGALAEARPAGAADDLASRIARFPGRARLLLLGLAVVTTAAWQAHPSPARAVAAALTAVALLRVPTASLLLGAWVVAAASVALPPAGWLAGGAAALTLVPTLLLLRQRPEVGVMPLVGFDGCHLLRTRPGRPTTTHHFLELERPLDRARLQGALAWLIDDVERLRTFVREAPLGLLRLVAPRLWCEPSSLVGWSQRPVEELERQWLARPFDLGTSPPIRLLHGPRAGGGFRLGLSLHHSVADGTGAMALLDGLLRRYDRLGGADVELPAIASRGPSCLRLSLPFGVRSLVRALVGALSTPLGVRSASVAEDERPGASGGDAVRVLRVPVPLFERIVARAREDGVTLNHLLLAASVRAAAAVRAGLGLPERPFRVLLPSDLRRLFALPASLPNYLGAVPLRIDAAEVGRPDLPLQIAARVRAGRSFAAQVHFPVQMGALALLPPALGRWCVERFDRDPRTFAFSFLFSHIRVPPELHLPRELGAPWLWCSSTQGRQPPFGVVLSTLGRHTTLALQHLEAHVGAGVIEAFERALREELELLAGPWRSVPSEPEVARCG